MMGGTSARSVTRQWKGAVWRGAAVRRHTWAKRTCRWPEEDNDVGASGFVGHHGAYGRTNFVYLEFWPPCNVRHAGAGHTYRARGLASVDLLAGKQNLLLEAARATTDIRTTASR